MKFDLAANKKIIVFIVAGIFIAYLDLAYILKMQLRSVGKAKTQITKLKGDLKALAADAERMRALEKKQAEQKQGAAGAKRLVQESQIDALLQEISNIAAKYNVNIISMQKKSARQEGAAPEKTKGGAKFTPYLINLSLSGDYGNFAKFIGDLEDFRDFIAVSNMTVLPGKKNLYTQDINLALKTYVVK